MPPDRRRGGDRPRLLVVGNGMSTDRLLDELAVRDALGSFAVTIVGEEPGVAYNRIQLSRVLAGAPAEEVATKAPGWYREQGICLIDGRWLQRLDTVTRQGDIGDGERVAYDLAVLATGSSPVIPPVGGLRGRGAALARGVHTLRTMEDCLALRDETGTGGPARQVVVVGGGLLGLEAAKVLCDLGHHVTVVHPSDTLLNAQLDELGGAFLRRAIEALGIAVVTGRVETALCRQSGVEALLLADQRVLPADTVLFTTGVRPRIDAAAASGIVVDRGIVVDDHLASSAPGVWAIGECAEHDGKVVGLVAPCWDHAAVVADQLAGTNPAARYRPTPSFARLKVAGVEVTSMGAVDPAEGDEVLQTIEERREVYRKLVIREGRLAGAVLVGDPDHGASLVRVFERAEPLPPNRVDLFCTVDAFASAPGAADLCNCNRVSEATVNDAIAAGSGTVEEIARATRAGTGCGSCVGQIRRLLDDAPALSVA
ncbi:MAG TPA: FAD-dependent oxidoreductase [Acidimicrobiales bacterium]